MSSNEKEDPAAAGEEGNTIQLDQMSLDQLDQLKQREENRMQGLTARYGQLRQAAARLAASQMAVNELQEASTNGQSSTSPTQYCDVFVPLTESVYVPGKIKLDDPGHNQLMVELGTGYFVEKSPAETVEFLNRKIRLVDHNSNNGTYV
jgi:prefoldin alpha subunit